MIVKKQKGSKRVHANLVRLSEEFFDELERNKKIKTPRKKKG